jgi:three-Cys-motif partner protein
MDSLQQFGGDWTINKLKRIGKYLAAYTQVLKNKNFHLIYIDAFAGTGYRTVDFKDDKQSLLFPDQAGEDAEILHTGSARIALETNPYFAEYYFVEQSFDKCRELNLLKQEYPDKAHKIHVIQKDANTFIQDICHDFRKNTSWRSVLFLDPFGMNVAWDTVEAIADTHAIDMWYLFPLGVGVNRLLRRDGNIPQEWQKRLDCIFGDRGWRDIFYKKVSTPSLFEDNTELTRKSAGFEEITRYLIKRLKTIFAGVAKNPLPLLNSRNNPLYLLCFACGNKRGAPIALRIAEHILKE